jgi:hypothetical protein
VRRDARAPWWAGAAVPLAAWLLSALGRTWRIERVGVEPVERAIAAGGRVLFAFWHARLLPLVWTHRRRGIAVLVSRSRDGELITRLIERLGFETARGSSTRGGAEGAAELLEWAGRGHLLAITPDGPRGPAERVKPGLAWLAARSGLPVVPVATAARPSWRLRSWDGFRVPVPFARVCVAYGEPMAVPGGLDAAGEAAWTEALERAIAAVTLAAEGRAGAGT